MIDEFLNQKEIAIVGVSRKKSKFGNVLYRELKKKGYNVYPINSNVNILDDDVCYPDLGSLPGKVDAVIINVPPAQAEKVLGEIKEAGINKVWLQQGSQSDEAEKFCEGNGIDCISNECVLMFAEPAGFLHRAHRWIWGALGKLPH